MVTNERHARKLNSHGSTTSVPKIETRARLIPIYATFRVHARKAGERNGEKKRENARKET